MSPRDRRMARRATEALIRQEMDQHPAERDDYPDDRRVRDIKKALADCEQEVTDDAVQAQFYHETRRYWKVARPAERTDGPRADPHAFAASTRMGGPNRRAP